MQIPPALRNITRMSSSEANSPPPMMANTTLYTLELESSAESIRGRLSAEDGTDHFFAGWLGLAHVLQRVLNRVEAE
jgi:hypothetical protein